MKASVHFATILKISANIIIELIKRHDIKSIFDAFKKLWSDACEKNTPVDQYFNYNFGFKGYIN